MQSVLGAADAEPSQKMGTKRIPDTGYTFVRSDLGTADAEPSGFIQTWRISHFSEICPRRSQCRNIEYRDFGIFGAT